MRFVTSEPVLLNYTECAKVTVAIEAFFLLCLHLVFC